MIVTVIVAALQAIAAIPAIGELLERATKELSQFFAEKAYQKQREAVEGATDQTRRALTQEEKIEALKAWHRALR